MAAGPARDRRPLDVRLPDPARRRRRGRRRCALSWCCSPSAPHRSSRRSRRRRVAWASSRPGSRRCSFSPASTKAAVLATFAYRLVSYWLPLPVGAAAWALHCRRYAAGPARARPHAGRARWTAPEDPGLLGRELLVGQDALLLSSPSFLSWSSMSAPGAAAVAGLPAPPVRTAAFLLAPLLRLTPAHAVGHRRGGSGDGGGAGHPLRSPGMTRTSLSTVASAASRLSTTASSGTRWLAMKTPPLRRTAAANAAPSGSRRRSRRRPRPGRGRRRRPRCPSRPAGPTTLLRSPRVADVLVVEPGGLEAGERAVLALGDEHHVEHADDPRDRRGPSAVARRRPSSGRPCGRRSP